MARTPGFGSPKPGLGCLPHFFAPDIEKYWSTRRRAGLPPTAATRVQLTRASGPGAALKTEPRIPQSRRRW